MSLFTQTEAEAIAKKLKADIEKGRKHEQALIRYQNQIIARYGIRRGSRSLGHDHIPRQIFLNTRQTLELARCPLSTEQYFEILRAAGKLPS